MEVSAVGWDRVVGQDAAVELLRSAAARPVHAYLLVGPRGSGVEEAARCFAASLVASGDDDERAWELALRGEHPDVVEIDPSTNQIVKDDADRFVREVHASPIEGERKVVMLLGAERLNDGRCEHAAQDDRGAAARARTSSWSPTTPSGCS